jgi:phosphoglycerate dehydrogenase-like enzyme
MILTSVIIGTAAYTRIVSPPDEAPRTGGATSHGATPIVIGLMNALPFDDSVLEKALYQHSQVPYRIRKLGYEEGRELHVAKTNGKTSAQVGHLEPSLTPVQIGALADVEVVLGLDVPFAIREYAPRLKWVQGVGAGVTQLVNVLKGSAIQLTSAAGVGAPGIAEFVMGRLLQVWKRFRLLDQQQSVHRWESQFGERVSGRTLGVVGLGSIGVEIARRAAAFDMRVVATKRHPGSGVPVFVTRVYSPAGLPDLLAEADAVVLATALNADTQELIGRAELALMRPGAILCNVSRGMVVNEEALAEALRSGHLRAAILDTTRTEPLPPTDPLWDVPNLYLSPHTSNSMDGYAHRLGVLLAENLNRYVKGLPLKNQVDILTGGR